MRPYTPNGPDCNVNVVFLLQLRSSSLFDVSHHRKAHECGGDVVRTEDGTPWFVEYHGMDGDTWSANNLQEARGWQLANGPDALAQLLFAEAGNLRGRSIALERLAERIAPPRAADPKNDGPAPEHG